LKFYRCHVNANVSFMPASLGMSVHRNMEGTVIECPRKSNPETVTMTDISMDIHTQDYILAKTRGEV